MPFDRTPSMSWQTVVRRPGEGERVLFKVGLMTFLATSAETDGHVALLETVLPPSAAVEPAERRTGTSP
jgi:hypothetical protein